MSNHITLEYTTPICDVRKFGKSFLLLDETLRLHRITPTFKKEKTFTLIKTESKKRIKQLLSSGTITFVKNDKPYFLSIKEKKLLPLEWFGENINSISESRDGKYLAVGYDNGRVNVFMTSGEIYQSLVFECGNIRSVAFDDKSDMLLAIGDRNKTVVHDVLLNRTLASIRTDIRISFALFIEGYKLFAVNENGTTSIINIKTASVESTHNNNIQNPTAIALNTNRDYGMVAERNGKITVIFLERNKILFSHQLINKPVSKIKWLGETLFFLFKDGTVAIYPLLSDHKMIEKNIEERDYKTASLLLKKNTFLSLFSDIEKSLDTVWNEEVFPQAMDLILDNRQDDAERLVDPFIHDVYKNKVFNLYTNNSDVVINFLKAYEHSDYATIFALAETYPHLKKSYKYRVINDEWELAYKKAFEAMKNGFKAKATQIFRSFNDIEKKKNLISVLTTFPNLFIEADTYHRTKQTAKYFALAAKNSVLKETPEYTKLIEEAERLLKKINEAEEKGALRDIIVLSKRLANYYPYKAKAKAFIESIRYRVLFLDHIQKGKKTDAYALVEQAHEITGMDEFQTLYAPFRAKEPDAYKAAFHGKTGDILYQMKDFLSIPLLKDKIASIIKISYLKSFLNVESVELTDWKSTIEYYSLFFGIDNDVKEATRQIGVEEVLYKMIGGKDKYGYRKYDFIDNIIKEKTEEQLLAEKQKAKKDFTHLQHFLFVIGGVLILALLAYIILNIFSSEIREYKDERRHGPYKLFERVYEKTGKGETTQ